MADIKIVEDGFHHFVSWGTTSLHELYILGEAIKQDTTFDAVEKDTRLAQWEKDLIELLIVIKPVFSLIIERFPGLSSLIAWATDVYNHFSSLGKVA